jgi:RNA recognition motif-containing protein
MYKCHIGCLPASCTSEELATYFSQYGSIRQVKVLRKSRRLCSGNAVLLCADEATMQRIVNIKTFSFGGRTIFCEPVLTGAELEEKNRALGQRRVFLSNLPPQMEDVDIGRLLSVFGPVENAYRIKSLKDVKRPFGFVTFYDSVAAATAVQTRKVFFGETKITISDFQMNKPPIQKKPKQSKDGLPSEEPDSGPNDVGGFEADSHSLKPTQKAYHFSGRSGLGVSKAVYRFNIGLKERAVLIASSLDNDFSASKPPCSQQQVVSVRD